ncbi:hypothetical protein AVEN_143247-1 [Araneus ventricosus]|uniref:Uncharacterized protein n=1 Tax=Araneus ventricosus TaxID=182803 RepID=A0A4Y2ADI0_ARAVE|nr:hypothetical protein AVEN_143247-1 [Araneus ventricosus]
MRIGAESWISNQSGYPPLHLDCWAINNTLAGVAMRVLGRETWGALFTEEIGKGGDGVTEFALRRVVVNDLPDWAGKWNGVECLHSGCAVRSGRE